MNATEAAEAAAIVTRFAVAVAGSAPAATGRSRAELRRACGLLTARAEALVRAGSALPAMLTAMDAAMSAGATLLGMGRVRAAMVAETPAGLPGTAIAQGGIRLALAKEARIIASTAFASRQDIATVGDRMHAAFEEAELVAADALDAASYRLIVALHATVTRFLADAARPLPRMIDYAFAEGSPAVALAYRLYGDAGRTAEVIAENKVVHPAFMPASGRALAS